MIDKEMAVRLRVVAADMAFIASHMSYYEACSAWRQRGKDLAEAAELCKGWADELERKAK